MTDLIAKNDLIQHFSSEEFVAKTSEQIAKDLAGLVPAEPLSVDMEKEILPQFKSYLINVLEDLSRGSSNSFIQFIYRVDLNEEKFAQTISGGNLEELSELIIRREAQKVFFKIRLSQ